MNIYLSVLGLQVCSNYHVWFLQLWGFESKDHYIGKHLTNRTTSPAQQVIFLIPFNFQCSKSPHRESYRSYILQTMYKIVSLEIQSLKLYVNLNFKKTFKVLYKKAKEAPLKGWGGLNFPIFHTLTITFLVFLIITFVFQYKQVLKKCLVKYSHLSVSAGNC